ncbi:MAG: SDR family oxidoreductase [Clostridiales bacterium]|jgi:3-oxoacyl-[acyl-carrier protein] reductase|nr:SDR family oxidoreductase [Clostridiales bacterium]MDR2751086.1 SDR family oxidoreductase [Clostridiales bacterium]
MKKYLIIGASSEMGMAFMQNIPIGEDIHLIAHCRNVSAQFSSVIEDLKGRAKVEVCKADLASGAETKSMIEFAASRFGSPTHILHLPADSFAYARMGSVEWEKIQRNIDIQVRSLFLVMREFLPQMAKSRYGKVAVVISAVTLGAPPKHMTDYVIAKQALLGLVRSAAVEYAGKGVNVNAVSPGMVETKFWSGVDGRLIELNAQNSLMKKNVRVEEVVAALEFLLSDKTDSIAGANLNLSGGGLM